MSQRTDFYSASPDALKAMIAFESAISKLGLEPILLDLIKLRASQINGCAFCVDLHSTDLKKAGEPDRRIYAVSVWREAPFFTERERAALTWTEAITLVHQTHASDNDYAYLANHFNEAEQVNLTVAINAINGWNRLAIGFKKSPAV